MDDPIDNDTYDMLEALAGGGFEYVKCPYNITSLPRGTMVMYFFKTGWGGVTLQSCSLCNACQKRQLKELGAIYLFQYRHDHNTRNFNCLAPLW